MVSVEFEGNRHPFEEKSNRRALQSGLTVVDDLRTLDRLDPQIVHLLSP